jgi:hypothetical protein
MAWKANDWFTKVTTIRVRIDAVARGETSNLRRSTLDQLTPASSDSLLLKPRTHSEQAVQDRSRSNTIERICIVESCEATDAKIYRRRAPRGTPRWMGNENQGAVYQIVVQPFVVVLLNKGECMRDDKWRRARCLPCTRPSKPQLDECYSS